MRCLNCGTEMQELNNQIIDMKEINERLKYAKCRCYKCNSKADCLYDDKNHKLIDAHWGR